MTPNKAKRKHQYWRVVIVYSDNETSGNRVFKYCDKAERWAKTKEVACSKESFDKDIHSSAI
jgi:hypothetical protein